MLRHQKFIAFVNLKGNNINNQGFKAICKILPHNTTLVNLNVEKNNITSLGLDCLTKIIKNEFAPLSLKELILSKNILGNNAIENFLSECSKSSLISHLEISDCNLSFENDSSVFESLWYWSQIQKVDLSFNIISNPLESLTRDCVMNHPSLRHLNLSYC